MSKTEMRWFEATRLRTKNTHGTGCSLSAAIAANCAEGLTPEQACATAKAFVTAAISEADNLYRWGWTWPNPSFPSPVDR